MDKTEQIRRIKKGIIFLRGFKNLQDIDLYRKGVVRFLDLVEEFINGGIDKDIVEVAKEMFNGPVTPTSGD